MDILYAFCLLSFRSFWLHPKQGISLLLIESMIQWVIVAIWLLIDETLPILFSILVYSIIQEVFCIGELLCLYGLGVVSVVGSNKNFILILLVSS